METEAIFKFFPAGIHRFHKLNKILFTGIFGFVTFSFKCVGKKTD